jgi:hypothetical protein
MQIAGETVAWRQWADANHVFSDCTVHLRGGPGGSQAPLEVYLSVTANTPKRRAALEDHASTLRFATDADKPAPEPAQP